MSTMATRIRRPCHRVNCRSSSSTDRLASAAGNMARCFGCSITGRVAQLREELSSEWPSISLSAQVALQKTGAASEGLWQEVLGIADGASVAGNPTSFFFQRSKSRRRDGRLHRDRAVRRRIGRHGAELGRGAGNWRDQIVVLLHRNQGQPELALIASIGGIGWVGADTHGLRFATPILYSKALARRCRARSCGAWCSNRHRPRTGRASSIRAGTLAVVAT